MSSKASHPTSEITRNVHRIPLCEALAAIACEADALAGTGGVNGIIEKRSQKESRIDRVALFAILRVAEKHNGPADVRSWLAEYLDLAGSSSKAASRIAQGANGAEGEEEEAKAKVSSRRSSPERVAASSRTSSPTSAKGRDTKPQVNKTSTRTPSGAPPPRSVNALRGGGGGGGANTAGGSGGGGGSSSILASRRSAGGMPKEKVKEKGGRVDREGADPLGVPASTSNSVSLSSTVSSTAFFSRQASVGRGGVVDERNITSSKQSTTGNTTPFSRAGSVGARGVARSSSSTTQSKAMSAPRVHTPTGERPSVVSGAPMPTRVSRQAPPSSTSYRAPPAAHSSYSAASSSVGGATRGGSVVGGGGGRDRSAGGARSVSADVPQRGSVLARQTSSGSLQYNSSASGAGGGGGGTAISSFVSGYSTPSRAPRTVTAANGSTAGSHVVVGNAAGLSTAVAGGGSRRAKEGRLREAWAAQVTAASKSLGSLSVHHHARIETLNTLLQVLEGGSDELVKHALNSEDFFCVTCGKLMPLLNHQLQSVDTELVRLMVNVVSLVVDALGPLFAPIMDTYFSRILWLMDCPAMVEIYEELSSHAAFLVEKTHHERMLCHLIDHIRYLDNKGDPLPHSIETSAAALKAAGNGSRRDMTNISRSKQLCVTLSFQLLELTVRRCCTRVQFSIDDLVHPNEYTLPYLDDLYCSDSQRAQALPLFVMGGASSSSKVPLGAEVSCIVEIFRRSVAKREGVDPKLVLVHSLPNYSDLEDGDDLYDFGRHPLIRAFEFIAQHTGKGLYEVAREAAVAAAVGSANVSPSRGTPPSCEKDAEDPQLSSTAKLLENASLTDIMEKGIGVDKSTPPSSLPLSRSASQSRLVVVPTLEAVAKYNATLSNAVNPLDPASAIVFQMGAAKNAIPINIPITQQKGFDGHRHRQHVGPSSSSHSAAIVAANEVTASADALAKTLTNDDFKHKVGRQSIERMMFVTAVAKRVWDTLILPIVGDASRPNTALPHAYHIFEGFLMLFPVHGSLLFAKEVRMEQRRAIARRLLDKTLRHMYNFPLFMRCILEDLSAEEVGGPLTSSETVTPLVDSPTTRLGQMNLRQARGAGGGARSSARLTSVLTSSKQQHSTTILSRSPSSLGGRSSAVGGSAASLMTADVGRAASPNLFAMMGHVYNPENSRIQLRAPSPKVGTTAVAGGSGGGTSFSRASSAAGYASPTPTYNSGVHDNKGGIVAVGEGVSTQSNGATAPKEANEPFRRSYTSGSSASVVSHGSAVSLNTLARIADPRGTHTLTTASSSSSMSAVTNNTGGGGGGVRERVSYPSPSPIQPKHSAGHMSASPRPTSTAVFVSTGEEEGRVGARPKQKSAPVVTIIDSHSSPPRGPAERRATARYVDPLLSSD